MATHRIVVCAAIAASMLSPMNGLGAQTTQPLLVSPAVQPQTRSANATLPQNTEVVLSLNDTLTTKGSRWSEGDIFGLTVVSDVVLGNRIAIPRGSRGVGRITWLTDKGAFGKSGKMEVDLEYVEVRGQRIPISGNQRREGEGNAAATVGGVILVGVLAGVITGRSGEIPQGTQLIGRTREDFPVNLESLPLTRRAQERLAKEAAKPAEQKGFGSRRIRCVTCQ